MLKEGACMEREQMLREIRKQQKLMLKLAAQSLNPLQDGVVYAKSCEIDELIVRYMRCEQEDKQRRQLIRAI